MNILSRFACFLGSVLCMNFIAKNFPVGSCRANFTTPNDPWPRVFTSLSPFTKRKPSLIPVNSVSTAVFLAGFTPLGKEGVFDRPGSVLLADVIASEDPAVVIFVGILKLVGVSAASDFDFFDLLLPMRMNC